MTGEKIIDLYKKLCTNLQPIGNLTHKEFENILELERFIDEKVITYERVESAFKRANESDFLCGRKNDFKASIVWITNPANIDKVNNGNYDNKKDIKRTRASLRNKIESHNRDFKQIEKEIYNDMVERNRQRRMTVDYWKDKLVWWERYPNLRKQEIHEKIGD